MMTNWPWRFWLLLFYFACDGGRGVVVLAVAGLGHADLAGQEGVLGLSVLFDILMVWQLCVRARAARFWGIVYVVTMSAIALSLLVLEPTRWSDLGLSGRIQELTTLACHGGVIWILCTRPVRQLLTR